MESQWIENRFSGREDVAGEFIQNYGSSVSIDDFFSSDFSLLNENGGQELYGDSHSITMNRHRILPDRSHSGFSKSEDSNVQRKCTRKRKITPNADVVKRQESSELIDDGYMWRKYGEKVIQKYKHPRSYFRCTYWEEGCEAKKRVQQISDNPPVYRTTCIGRHTCESSFLDSGFVLDHLDGESSNMIRFDKLEHKESRDDPEKMIREDRVLDQSQEEGFPVGESRPYDDFPMVDPFDFRDPVSGFSDPWFFGMISEILPMEPFPVAE